MCAAGQWEHRTGSRKVEEPFAQIEPARSRMRQTAVQQSKPWPCCSEGDNLRGGQRNTEAFSATRAWGRGGKLLRASGSPRPDWITGHIASSPNNPVFAEPATSSCPGSQPQGWIRETGASRQALKSSLIRQTRRASARQLSFPSNSHADITPRPPKAVVWRKEAER
jgi:hypothetical protein